MANNDLDVSQINLGRHLKVRAPGVHFDLHSGPDFIGAWLDNGTGGQNSLGLFMRKGEQPYIMCWPEANFGCKLPFSFGPMGLQVPHTDGSVTHLTLAEISSMVQSLGRARPYSGASVRADNHVQPLDVPAEAPTRVNVGELAGKALELQKTIDSIACLLTQLPAGSRAVEMNILLSQSPDMHQAVQAAIAKMTKHSPA